MVRGDVMNDSNDVEKIRAEQRAIKQRIKAIAKSMRITKVVATRSIRTPTGDVFVGMSGFAGASESVQDSYGGQGVDLMPSSEEEEGCILQGMSLKDADVARLLLSHQVEKAAWENAFLSGSVSENVYRDNIQAIDDKYLQRYFRRSSK